MILRRIGPAAAAAALLAVSLHASAQDEGGGGPPRQRPPVSSYAKPAAFPNENKAAVTAAMTRARQIAGADLFPDFVHRCIISPTYRTRVSGIQHNGIVQPTKLFDNLYSVGQNAVSSHALVTSEGIVLFDTLNNEDEAKNIIVPNLVAMGLDPKNLKYVVITHEHGDHYGGARYLQKTYGARVVSSKVGWDAMDRLRNQRTGAFAGVEPPDRDMEVADGQALKVGDQELKFYLTPGHTMGTISTIFKVRQNGRTHTVGYFGGTGGGGQPENLRAQITSLQRWMGLTRAAGVDVLIANHPLHDRGIENNEIIRYSPPGAANPYVLGAATYQRYMQVQQECARVYLGKFGFTQ